MQTKNIFKYRIKVIKNNELRFISHLDWQGLILKTFRRCNLKLVLSEGFNKMPKVSYSPALPIFIESDCELINFQTYEPLKEDFIEQFNNFSPKGITMVELKEITNNFKEPKSLENYLQWAQYEAFIKDEKKNIYNFDEIRYIIDNCLSSNEFLIAKKTKKGIEKTVNYRNSIKKLELKDDGHINFVLKVGQNDEIPALRADEFIKKLFNYDNIFRIKRINFFDSEMKII